MKYNQISYEQAQGLPHGTVLQFNKDSYSIVTDAGIRFFDYKWYKGKFEQDSVNLGIGAPDDKKMATQAYNMVLINPLKIESVLEQDNRNNRYAKGYFKNRV